MLEIKNVEMKYLNAKNRKIEGNVRARPSNIFGNCYVSRFPSSYTDKMEKIDKSFVT